MGERLFERGTERDGCRNGAKKGAAPEGSAEQYGALQKKPRTPIRLSCAEIRRLFWQLVLAVERSVAAILRWSTWRRWHQAWARYYHYRRRKDGTPARNEPSDDGGQAQPVAEGHVLEVVWQRLERLLPPVRRVGHPYDHDRRLVLEAIVYVMETDCGWRQLPSHFPSWQTVYTQLTQWRQAGIWDIIWSGFAQPHPADELQL